MCAVHLFLTFSARNMNSGSHVALRPEENGDKVHSCRTAAFFQLQRFVLASLVSPQMQLRALLRMEEWGTRRSAGTPH